MKKILLSAFLLVAAYSTSFAYLTQGHFRWRNNNGSEKTATWKAGQDTAITISDFKAIRLRMEVTNNTGSTKNIDRNLQYATSVNGPWIGVFDNSQIAAFTFGGNNGYIANNDSTTTQITDAGFAFLAGNIVATGVPYTDSIPDKKRREYEWCIKPTQYIQANTTYYFKSSAGAAQSVLPSLTTTGPLFAPAPTPLITNGGFENGLTGWTTAITNGSNASFNITTAAIQQHTGSKGLKVVVTSRGATNAVTLASGPLTLTDTGTYMLRFWAFAKQRNSIIDVNIKGATTNNTCHYQIYDRFDTTKSNWQQYQYAFRITEQPVTVQFNFNSNATYYLDDIEVINDSTNPNIDVKNQYDWQNNFAETFGWLSGDNNNPVLLPDNRVAWVYNDSFMGTNNPHSNVLSSNYIINNLVVVQDGEQLRSVYKGTASNSSALFSPGNGNLFWQSGGVVENNKLKILLIEISGGNYANHSWVGTLNLPDLSISTLVKLPATITSSPNCVFQDGSYNYIYIGASSSQNEVHTIVARVPVGQFDSQTAWEYYLGNNAWSTSYTNAANLLEGVTAGNVIKLGPNNYAMSGVPNLAAEIDVWFARSPVGPWGNKAVVYYTPQQEGILAYEGHVSPLGKNGVYTFSYSVYPFVNEPNGSSGSVAMQRAVKTTYVPIYAKANLLKLSPYTTTNSTDSLITFTGTVKTSKIILDWTTALKDDSHFDMQRSIDGGNTWQALGAVAGSDSVSLRNYEMTDPTPYNGPNYYRIVSYNIDNQQSISSVIKVTPPDVLTAYSASLANKVVTVKFSTALRGHDHFLVQYSLDNVTFYNSPNIPGDNVNDHQFSFNYPPPGSYYLRMALFGPTNIMTVTPSALVNFPAIAASTVTPQSFTVYPNPANANVSFALKGYTGKTFTVTLSSLYGKQLGKQTFTVNDAGSYALTNRPSPGTYLINVSGDGLAKSARVIVQ